MNINEKQSKSVEICWNFAGESGRVVENKIDTGSRASTKKKKQMWEKALYH